jgi:hypothetical protein
MERRAKHKIALIVWIGLFFLLGSGVWNFLGGELMLIIYLAVSVLAYVSYAFLSRCPQCRMPLLLRPVRILGMEFFQWSIITPAKCRHCGEPVR